MPLILVLNCLSRHNINILFYLYCIFFKRTLLPMLVTTLHFFSLIAPWKCYWYVHVVSNFSPSFSLKPTPFGLVMLLLLPVIDQHHVSMSNDLFSSPFTGFGNGICHG